MPAECIVTLEPLDMFSWSFALIVKSLKLVLPEITLILTPPLVVIGIWKSKFARSILAPDVP